MTTRWFFILLVIPFLLNAKPTEVIFFTGNLSSAKAMAANEGKLYFAEFTASWCASCRVLEETTFSDPTVVDYISRNYIPVKIDIDDFDGIALKQVYNVQSIPTIIVFNSKGQLLKKYDKGLPASTMLSLLKKHNIPANRVKTSSAANVNAKPIIRNTSSNAKQSNAAVSPAKEAHSPMKYSNVPSRPDKTPATPIRTNESIPTRSTAKPSPQGDGLYRFSVSTQPSKGFSVQIGAFKEYGNVLREVERIQDDYSQPIIVHIVRQRDVSIYKILIGDFENRQQAISYQSQLKTKGLEGVIKDLSTMK